jgi:hypothetical protein
VVEHSLGKGEVESSILSGSTSHFKDLEVRAWLASPSQVRGKGLFGVFPARLNICTM